MDVLNLLNEIAMIEFADKIEGYYWTADSQTPMVVRDGKDLPWKSSQDLPAGNGSFVVAAFLCEFDDNGNPFRSIHVRFVDGGYKCEAVTLPQEHDDPQVFIGDHRLPGLKFLQLWEEDPSPDEAEFVAMMPGKSLFVGFEK